MQYMVEVCTRVSTKTGCDSFNRIIVEYHTVADKTFSYCDIQQQHNATQAISID